MTMTIAEHMTAYTHAQQAYKTARRAAIRRGYNPPRWYDDNKEDAIHTGYIAAAGHTEGNGRPQDATPMQAAIRAIIRAEYAGRPRGTAAKRDMTGRGYSPAAAARDMAATIVDIFSRIDTACRADGRRVDAARSIRAAAVLILARRDTSGIHPRTLAAARHYIAQAIDGRQRDRRAAANRQAASDMAARYAPAPVYARDV